MCGPHPPVPPAGVNAIWWNVEADEFGGVEFGIVFNVSVDLPDSDDHLFIGVKERDITPYLPTKQPDTPGGEQYRPGIKLVDYYKRGIYIASVSGATVPFFLRVLGTDDGRLLLKGLRGTAENVSEVKRAG